MKRSEILLIGTLLLSCCTLNEKPEDSAVLGKIYISKEEFVSTGKGISLAGEWEHFPKEFLTPEELLRRNPPEFIKIPTKWTFHSRFSGKSSVMEYGTLKLTVRTDADKLILFIPSVYEASRLWINGQEIHQAGIPGKDSRTMKPGLRPTLNYIVTSNGAVEIVIQYSNINLGFGVMPAAPAAGIPKEYERRMFFRQLAHIFFIFLTILSFLFFLMLFITVKKGKKELLYLGLLGLVLGVISLTNNETLLSYILQSPIWYTTWKPIYTGLPLVNILTFLFFKSLYRKKITIHHYIYLGLWIILGIVQMILPIKFQARTILVMLILTAGNIGYILFATVKNQNRRKWNTILATSSMALILLGVVGDILFYSGIIRFGPLTSYIMIFFMIFQSLIVIAELLKNAQRLQLLSTQLEAQVQTRTRELNETNSYLRDEITKRRKIENMLRKLSTTDSLTQLPNRREFDRLFALEKARSTRYNTPLSLVLFDLDWFKKINDQYGHDTGDRVLKIVSHKVRQTLRTADMIARWGGEEFILLLPGLNLSEAHAAAERLRMMILEIEIPPVANLSASFGVAQCFPGEDEKELFIRIDGALYKAKNSGRNRCIDAGFDNTAEDS